MRACASSHYLGIYIGSTYREHNEQGSIQVERTLCHPWWKTAITEKEHEGITFGRISWETCLIDAFGNPMRLLFGLLVIALDQPPESFLAI